MAWEDLKITQPHKGQVIEVLVWKPAVYKGLNDYGYHEFLTLDYLETVYYWRLPEDRYAYYETVKYMKGQSND